MKRAIQLLSVVVFNCFGIYCSAQNLVPNPSFESYVSCPTSPTQIQLVYDWISNGYSPDYFNDCAPSCAFPGTCLGVTNWAGFQLPYEGNGYVGIVLRSFELANGSEIIGTQLTQQLNVGKKYFVSAYVCRANGIESHGASNNFGFHFYTIPHDDFTNRCPFDNFSQVHDSSIITDSVNWTKVSGSFIADSAYEYLAIGNFYDDLHTDTLDMNPVLSIPWNEAYYYIDNVCVSEDSLWQASTGINSESSKQELRVYPNPFTEKLFIECADNNQKEIFIYDFCARKILNQYFTNSFLIDSRNFISGIYFYEVVDKIGLIKTGRIIKE